MSRCHNYINTGINTDINTDIETRIDSNINIFIETFESIFCFSVEVIKRIVILEWRYWDCYNSAIDTVIITDIHTNINSVIDLDVKTEIDGTVTGHSYSILMSMPMLIITSFNIQSNSATEHRKI